MRRKKSTWFRLAGQLRWGDGEVCSRRRVEVAVSKRCARFALAREKMTM
jgi:hypothetical protein